MLFSHFPKLHSISSVINIIRADIEDPTCEPCVPFLKTFKVYYSSGTAIKIEMLDIYYVLY